MSENQNRCSGDDRVWNEFFDWVTGGDDYLYESKLWSHDRMHPQAVDEEWTRDDGDVKRVLVKFSDAHDWNTRVVRSAAPADGETESRAERETR